MNYNVFISYSSKDSIIASDICNKLEESGLVCWMAPRNIDTGVSFAKAIIEGIKGSHYFLLIYTKDSNESEQVLREVDRAVHFEKKIIVFKLDDQTYSDSLEYYLCKADCIDATRGKYQQYLKEIESKVGCFKKKNEKLDHLPAQKIQITKTLITKKRNSKFIIHFLIYILVLLMGLYFRNVFFNQAYIKTKVDLPLNQSMIKKTVNRYVKLPDDLYKKSNDKLYDERFISALRYEDLKLLYKQIQGLGGDVIRNSRAGLIENQLSEMSKNNLDLIDHFMIVKLSESLPVNNCKKLCLSIMENSPIKMREFIVLKELENILVKKYGVRAQKLYKTLNQKTPDECSEQSFIPILLGFKETLEQDIYIKIFAPIDSLKPDTKESSKIKIELIKTTNANSNIQVFFSKEEGLVDLIRRYAVLICEPVH